MLLQLYDHLNVHDTFALLNQVHAIDHSTTHHTVLIYYFFLEPKIVVLS